MLRCYQNSSFRRDSAYEYCKKWDVIKCGGHENITKCSLHVRKGDDKSTLDAVDKSFMRYYDDAIERVEQLCTFGDLIECRFNMTEWDGDWRETYWSSDMAEEMSLLATDATPQSESAAKDSSAKVAFAVAGGLGVIALGIYAMRNGKKATDSEEQLLA